MTVPAINLSDAGVNKEVIAPYVFINLENQSFQVESRTVSGSNYTYISTYPSPIYFKTFDRIDFNCPSDTRFNITEANGQPSIESVDAYTIRWLNNSIPAIQPKYVIATLKGWTIAYSVNLASSSTTNVVTYPNLPNITSSSISTSPLGTNLAVGVTLTAGYTGSLIWRYRVDSATYQWVRGSSSTGPWTNISGATSSNYSLTSSDVGYFISCTITGINHRGTTSVTPSGVFLFAAPTGLSSSNITSTTATISWNSLTGATGYQYAYGTSTNPTNWSSTITGTTVNLTGLVANTKYYFAVRAIRNTDTGPASTSASFNTWAGSATTLSATIGLYYVTGGASNTFGKVVLSNISPPSGGGAATYSWFKIQYAVWNSANNTLGTWTDLGAYSVVSSITLTSAPLINGTQYKFRTAISDSSGNQLGEWSSISAAVTPLGPPGAPTITGVTKGADGTSLTFNWNTAVTLYGGSVTGWAVSRVAADTWSIITVDSASSHTFSNLSTNTSYTLKVKALVGTEDANAVAFSTSFNSITATTATTPGTPTSLTVTPSRSGSSPTLDLSWIAPVDNGGATITSYEYRYAKLTTDLSSTTWNDTGSSTTSATINPSPALSLNTTYYVQVRAKNGVGTGVADNSPSNAKSGTTWNVPDAPKIAVGDITVGAGYLDFKWSAPTSEGGTAITGYQYQITTSSSPGSTWTSTTSLSAPRYYGTNGTKYYCFVRAKNALGTGAYNSGSGTLPTPATVPSAPASCSGAVVTAGSSFKISWTAPTSDGGAAISGYKVERAKFNNGTWSAWVSVGSFGSTTFNTTVTGITAGTHKARVRATNSVGDSAWKESAQFTV